MNQLSQPPHSQHAKRNALTLSSMQAFGGTNAAIIVAVGGLAGQNLASHPALSTVPISVYHLGLALGTIPAAMIMRKLGRKTGYLIGTTLGVIGGITAATGIYSSLFFLFCLGTFLAGMYASYVQSYRFAAADNVEADFRPKAISWVLAGGLVGAFIASQAIIHTQSIGLATPYAASFLAQASLTLMAVPLVLSLRFNPVVKNETKQNTGRSLREIARSAYFIVAVLTGVVSYGLMTLIMTAAPLAMHGCGHSLSDSTFGIQWHILGMYGPSFFTGHLINRFGKIPISMLGILIIGAASAVALTGISVAHFWTALILLGIGWNFGFIGATAMVTECYLPEEKNKVQALNDFMVFGTVAFASFSSGQMLAAEGWDTLNYLVFPVISLVFLSLLWLFFKQRTAPALEN